MAPTDRQPTESHLAAARSRMVSIQSSLHACVGRHLFSDCAASPAGAGLARAALPAGGDQEERRAASFSDCAASPAGAGLARVARLSPACRRRSGGAGRHFSRTTRHRRPGGIGSHGSPFPCLPAAIRRSGGGAGQAHFFSDCAASLAGAGLARAARLSLACRRRPAERRAVSFSEYAALFAGAGLARAARRSLACRRRSGGIADRHLFSDCAASPAGTGLARIARLSLACRRRPYKSRKCRKATFLFWRAASGKPGCSPK